MEIKKARTEIKPSVRDEINSFEEKLLIFKLSFEKLAKMTPLNKKKKEMVLKTANFIIENDLIDYVYENKKLPIKTVSECLKINKFFLTRHRKYIIAILLIVEDDSSYLYRFIEDDLM